MGKRILVQRRGKGSKTFQASTHKRIAPTKYPNEKKGILGNSRGKIQHLHHDPGRGSPLAHIELDSGESYYSVVPEGAFEGQSIELSKNAPIKIGNVVNIGNIPEGTVICNIELSPGDGGKIARSSGSYATIISHTSEGSTVKLPSGKSRLISNTCRATIGIVAGAGRTDKPFLKAGRKFNFMKAKGHKYPRVRGRAMIAAVHPFGSGRRGGRKGTTVSHGAPPGRKVGLIGARGAGRKKRSRS